MVVVAPNYAGNVVAGNGLLRTVMPPSFGGGGGPAPAAIPTILGSTSANNGVCNIPAEATVGSTLIAIVGGGDLVTDLPAPAGWTRKVMSVTSGRATGAVFTKQHEGDTSPVSFPFTGGTADGIAVSILAIADAEPTDPVLVLDRVVTSNTVNHTLAPLPVQDNDTFVIAAAVGGWGGAFRYTPPSGFTELYDFATVAAANSGCVLGVAFRELVAEGTLTGTFVNTTSLHFATYGIRVNPRSYVLRGTPIFFPMRSTTVDPTSSDWRTIAGNSAGYVFRPNVGITLNTPITNAGRMLSGASTYNDPDTAVWDTTGITSMFKMFQATSVFNQPIGGWDVSSVTNMTDMLLNSSTFNQDLSQWCVSGVPSLPSNFAVGSALAVENYPVWGTCPA